MQEKVRTKFRELKKICIQITRPTCIPYYSKNFVVRPYPIQLGTTLYLFLYKVLLLFTCHKTQEKQAQCDKRFRERKTMTKAAKTGQQETKNLKEGGNETSYKTKTALLLAKRLLLTT